VRRKLSLVLAGVISIAVVATVIESRRVEESARRVSVHGQIAPDLQAFFADPQVKQLFARHHINLDVSSALDSADDFVLSDAPADSRALRLSSPLVVTAPTAALPALEGTGVVTKSRMFDLARYMALERQGKAPVQITPPAITSKAGALFAAVAGAVVNGRRMPATLREVDDVINAVSALFRAPSGALHVALLSSGAPNLTVLAMEPAIVAGYALTPRSQLGERVLQLMGTDDSFRKLATGHGIRLAGSGTTGTDVPSNTILNALTARVEATLLAGTN
jgi:hypothetical protein